MKIIVCFILGLIYFTILPSQAANKVDQENADFLFQDAMQKRESGDLEAAIKAFQGILNINPALHRARLELAVAYFQVLNYAEAKAQAERVLNDRSVPEGVKVRIRQFLDQLAAASRTHTWTPYVSLGYVYDSNVSARPSSSIYQIGATGITLNAEAEKRGDHGVLLSTSLSHRYMSPDLIRLGAQDVVFLWQSQGSFYRADYNHTNEFDLTVLSLSTGPAWIAAHHWRSNINVQVDHLTLGSDTYGTFSGVTPTFTKILNNGRTELTFDAQWQTRGYSRGVDAGRDGYYEAVGITAGQLLPGDKVSVQMGLHGFKENTDRAYYSNHGNELFAGANWRISASTSAYARTSKRISHFNGDDPTYLQRRNDAERQNVFGATYTFSSGVLTKWALSANYIRTNNTSDLEVYAYGRYKTRISLGRSF